MIRIRRYLRGEAGRWLLITAAAALLVGYLYAVGPAALASMMGARP